MQVVAFNILANTTEKTDIIDITPQVKKEIKGSGIRNGNVTLFTPGSTAGLTTIEYESGVINDLKKAIERMAPEDIYYEHNERWGDGNGYSHVRSAIVGGSFTVPVVDGRLVLGTWQQIVLMDFDNHGRTRRVVVQVTGEA